MQFNENKNDATKTVEILVGEQSSKFLELLSIFESEETETKSKLLLQKSSTKASEMKIVAADATPVDNHGIEQPAVDDVPVAKKTVDDLEAGTSDAAVSTDCVDGGWMGQPVRDLLFVIHPWCMLRKSATDRQSEFPPPGFLERLKAKLLAFHRETDEQQRRRGPQSPATAAAGTVRRRRENNQKIKYWIHYTAAVAELGGSRVKSIVTSAEKSKANDFLTVRQRYATIAATASSDKQCRPATPKTSRANFF